MSTQHRRTLMRIQFALGALFGVLLVLLIIEPPWIERFLGVDTDAGSGATEMILTSLLGVASLLVGVLARRSWRLLNAAS